MHKRVDPTTLVDPKRLHYRMYICSDGVHLFTRGTTMQALNNVVWVHVNHVLRYSVAYPAGLCFVSLNFLLPLDRSQATVGINT